MSEETKVRKLPESRFRLAEQVRNVWNIVPEEGTSFDALKDPAYWAHNARRMRPGDLIEVVPDEETYWALLRVVKVGAAGVAVSVLMHETAEAAAEIPSGLAQDYEVKWKGPHHRYTVLRKGTRDAIQTGFGSEAEAAKWIVDNAKSLTVPKAA